LKSFKRILLFLAAACFAAAMAYVYVYAYALPKKYRNAVEQTGFYDKGLVYSVIMAESGFNENAVSKKGAVGLMQIKASTAEYVVTKYSLPHGDLKDGEYNILVGGTYLKYLSGKFCGFTAVVAAYNAGEGRVKAWLNDKNFSSDGISLLKTPFAETNAYISRVKKFYKFYKFLAKNT